MVTRTPSYALIAATALVACGAPPPPAVHNTTEPTARVTVAPDQPLGALAYATAARIEGAGFVPVSAEHPLVLVSTEPPPARVEVIGTRGELQTFRDGRKTSIPYGCDGNPLEVVAFAGPRLPPGVAWVLPANRPASWHPAPLAITTTTAAAAHRRYAIGPLAVELTRTAALAGTLTITRGGAIVHRLPFERTVMDGADDAPIDLTESGPHVPEPVAAWALAGDAGPVLVVLLGPGYEGSSLQALLVEEGTARRIEALDQYLYACAF